MGRGAERTSQWARMLVGGRKEEQWPYPSQARPCTHTNGGGGSPVWAEENGGVWGVGSVCFGVCGDTTCWEESRDFFFLPALLGTWHFCLTS